MFFICVADAIDQNISFHSAAYMQQQQHHELPNALAFCEILENKFSAEYVSKIFKKIIYSGCCFCLDVTSIIFLFYETNFSNRLLSFQCFAIQLKTRTQILIIKVSNFDSAHALLVWMVFDDFGG